MPWHMTYVCPKCGARQMSPEMEPDLKHMQLAMSAIVLSRAKPTLMCYRCNPTEADNEPALVEGRAMAIYPGPPEVH